MGNEYQYICKNCFSRRDCNDVLFGGELTADLAPDRRKELCWRELHPESGGLRCGQRMVDWRMLPMSHRVLKGEAVAGVLDYSGKTFSCRICPDCHYPLRGERDGLVLLPWSKNGYDPALGEKFLCNLEHTGRWRVQSRDPDADQALLPLLACIQTDSAGALLLPLGIEDSTGAFSDRILQHYFSNSMGTLLYLKLRDRSDIEAVNVLLDYTQLDGERGETTRRPTAVLLEREKPLPREPVLLQETLEREHKSFYNALRATLKVSSLFAAQDAQQAALWLLASAGMEKTDGEGDDTAHG